MKAGPALIDTRTAAIALFGRWTGGTKDAVYRMIERNDIAAVRDGRKYWIPAAEIDRIRNMKVDEA
jgi:excisionase family DNA binding protein